MSYYISWSGPDDRNRFGSIIFGFWCHPLGFAKIFLMLIQQYINLQSRIMNIMNMISLV